MIASRFASVSWIWLSSFWISSSQEVITASSDSTRCWYCLILYFAVIVSNSCRSSNAGDQTSVIFSIFERITNVEISATNTKKNVITSTVIRYNFNFPATFKLAICFLIFSMIVFPSFVNFQFNFYVLKRPYYSTVDWKNLLKNIIFFTKY